MIIKKLLEAVKKGKRSKLDLESRYTKLSSKRNNFLQRAYEFARMTLPYLLSPISNGDATNQHGFQGIGAQVTNHLSNKIVTNMFPIGMSFFRSRFSDASKKILERAGFDPEQLSQLLVTSETKVDEYQVRVAARVAYVEAAKNLLVSGNVLLYLPPEGALQAIKLDRYCVRRNMSGKLLELMTMQEIEMSSLSEEMQTAIMHSRGIKSPQEDEMVKVYTWVYRQGKQFLVAQSVEGVMVADVQYIDEDQLPWIPLRWNSTHGEDYGRGLVEDHSGDFNVIEFLSEAIAKGMVHRNDKGKAG